MKYADINKRFTETVAEYMAKGYTINTATMGGSQGETAKIDLTNGTEIIRIRVESFYEIVDDYCNIEGDEIIVGKVMDDVKPNDNIYGRTVWNNRLEIISRERFYIIDKEGDFYGTKEEATKVCKIRTERWYRRRSAKVEFVPSEKIIDLAVKIAREKMGYRRVNRADVKVTKNPKTNQYTVGYNRNYYTLH